jgi:NAD(P)-dependent dehydrogenase (short-subunit alcohol dehydrogenase family)
MGLRSKVGLIAGASGAIGASVAQYFYKEGADLALTYRNVKPDVLSEEPVRESGRIVSHKIDVSEMCLVHLSTDYVFDGQKKHSL